MIKFIGNKATHCWVMLTDFWKQKRKCWQIFSIVKWNKIAPSEYTSTQCAVAFLLLKAAYCLFRWPMQIKAPFIHLMYFLVSKTLSQAIISHLDSYSMLMLVVSHQMPNLLKNVQFYISLNFVLFIWCTFIEKFFKDNLISKQVYMIDFLPGCLRILEQII